MKITPSEGGYIAGYLMPDGRMEYQEWAFHYAAVCEGKAYDEIYPNGIIVALYKRKFQYWDKLNFTKTPFVFWSNAIKRAK